MATLNIRVPDDLHDEIAEIARERNSTITAETIRLLQHVVALEQAQADASG